MIFGNAIRAIVAALASIAFLGCGGRHHVNTEPAVDPLEVVPASWIDLPDAPFVASVVDGTSVLLNRSNRSFDEIETGCVVEQDGRTRVVGRLFTTRVDDAVFAPNRTVGGVLRTLNNLDYYVKRSDVKPCPEAASLAVIRAQYSRGQGEWSAEGTTWPH
jgi:hypothetical protein